MILSIYDSSTMALPDSSVRIELTSVSKFDDGPVMGIGVMNPSH